MTHEELLERVKDIPTTCAVVKLHRLNKFVPDGSNYYPQVNFKPQCNHCDTPYPCPTNQAIEKELQ